MAFAGLKGAGLPAPTSVGASDGAYATKVGVTWDVIRGATSYEVFRNTVDDAASATQVGATASLIFFDATAVTEQNYFYWVRARNGSTVSDFSAPDQGFRADGEIPGGFIRPKPLEPPPAPPENPVTGAKVYLGKTLFWDEQLSSTRTVSCGTCHLPRAGGGDPRSNEIPETSTHPGPDGIFGNDDDALGSRGVPMTLADGSYQPSEHFGFREQVTKRKALAVMEAAYGSDLFWDGRARTQFVDPMTGTVDHPKRRRTGVTGPQALDRTGRDEPHRGDIRERDRPHRGLETVGALTGIAAGTRRLDRR